MKVLRRDRKVDLVSERDLLARATWLRRENEELADQLRRERRRSAALREELNDTGSAPSVEGPFIPVQGTRALRDTIWWSPERTAYTNGEWFLPFGAIVGFDGRLIDALEAAMNVAGMVP